jgi:hypothetical protein
MNGLFSLQAIVEFGWRVPVWALAIGAIASGWFSPWVGLCMLGLLSVIEICLSCNWYNVRLRQLRIMQPGDPPVAALLADERDRTADQAVRRAFAWVLPREYRRFRIVWAVYLSVATIATGNTLLLVISPHVWFASVFAHAGTRHAVAMLGIVFYLLAALLFFALRAFVDNRGLVAWRDSCSSSTRSGVELFVRLLCLNDDEGPGRAWVASVVVLVFYTWSMLAVATAASYVKPADWPSAPAHSTVAVNSPAGKVHTKAKSVGGGSSGGTRGSVQSGTTTTTAPPSDQNPDIVCVSTQVKLAMSDSLPTSVDTSVEAEYEDHASELQCLVLDPSGNPSTTRFGNLEAVMFASSDGDTQTGVIVYNAVGDTAVVMSGETVFTEAVSGISDIQYVTDIAVIEGAQLRLAVLDNGSCIVGIRPDANSDWTAIPASEGAAVLSVFMSAREIGRPLGQGQFQFAYGNPQASITTGASGQVVVQGPDAETISVAESATTCPTLETLEKDALAGPPAA